MTVLDELIAIIDRILAAGSPTELDLAELRRVWSKAEPTLQQSGKYIVNIQQGEDIQIGDRIYQGANAEAIRRVFQEVLDARRLRTLLTPNEFADRVEQLALTTHQGCFVGREIIRKQLHNCLDGASSAIILHGSGGLGKTRLLLTLPDTIAKERSLWYIRNEAESLEPDIASLNRDTQHIIVVDDAHRFSLLYQLREVIVNTELAGKVTLILATRSIFKDSLIYQLGLPGDRVETIEAKPLDNQDIDQILQHSPHSITNQDIRHTIVRIAQGNPLIAGIATRLHQGGIDLINLTRDRVLTRHLDEIIKDLSETDRDAHNSYHNYIKYLQILAALGTVNLDEQELQAKIYELIGISPIDEERIVSRLVEAGLVERYWNTLKIASEVLADHILVQHFFDPKTKRADYQKQILEPFFSLKPRQILTNLAEAEVKGESSATGLLLQEKLDELYQIVNHEGNIARFVILGWLKDIAYLRPDDILAIVALIVDEPEQPPEIYHYQKKLRGSLEIKHEMVLHEAVEVLLRSLDSTIDQWDDLPNAVTHFREAVDYLHKLAIYQPEEKEYARVREQAGKAIVEIAEFKKHKYWAVQLTLLEIIEGWLKADFAINLDLSLTLIKLMLRMEFDDTTRDPTKYLHIVIHKGMLVPNEFLLEIRHYALKILYQAYSQASILSERSKIVKTLDGAVLLPCFINASEVPAETWAWLQPNCQNTARFLLKVAIPQGELPILDAIAEWLWNAERFSRYQLDELEQLRQQLQNSDLYCLYRVLVSNRFRGDSEDDRLDLKVIDQRHQQVINQYIEALSPATIKQAICELETIVEQSQSAGESSTPWLNSLFYKLGEKQPDLAQQLVKQAIAENLALKHHLGSVIAGLRCIEPQIAWTYIQTWIKSDNPILWQATEDSYRFVDWSNLETHEWEVLRHLVAKGSSLVDGGILWLIRQFAPHNPNLAVELLKTMATRGDQNTLRHIAQVLSARKSQEGWIVKFANPQDYLEIIQNFKQLRWMDSDTEECLNRLGEIAPMQVVDFIEQRMSLKAKHRAEDVHYRVLPLSSSGATNSIRCSLEYPDVLRRVRDWMLREDGWFYWETPRILKGIAVNLEQPLYAVLMEWVNSGDIHKQKAVARILGKFNVGQAFYDMSRELILLTRARDEAILNSIQNAIHSTPGASWGQFSNHTQQRLEEVSPWHQDENSQVRHFANRIVASLQEELKRQVAHEDFEKRTW